MGQNSRFMRCFLQASYILARFDLNPNQELPWILGQVRLNTRWSRLSEPFLDQLTARWVQTVEQARREQHEGCRQVLGGGRGSLGGLAVGQGGGEEEVNRGEMAEESSRLSTHRQRLRCYGHVGQAGDQSCSPRPPGTGAWTRSWVWQDQSDHEIRLPWSWQHPEPQRLCAFVWS